ncbi:predicted protein [Phaeodactylum tricornutum CCAP 1055/1]|jgi:ATP-dependent Clp protease adapter protein ClpS|uniref:Uncharacterized protein n=3 Tax=Sar TaxID=2698737 RepID=B7S497_PHATC|nr:predicted protein [Phaeodactylum tricornutum CCAP 1055/1]EEC42650.1 predicted protein [Phaeodactylum tricornutum CCAP 1055/1]|eukprot:XP_002176414.1 predicted protein [Phaeodactylum tricornutum CCAP 1055/1]
MTRRSVGMILSAVWLALLTLLGSTAYGTMAFTAAGPQRTRFAMSPLGGATTMDPPTKERTQSETNRRRRGSDNDRTNDDEDNTEYPDLEYLQDSAESREINDPFHILLMGSTFDKPKITVTYVSGSLEYVLQMPSEEATELSSFAREEGMACLGTWPREKCLNLGRQLQMRDIVCRVVPFCEGGQRGWQAKDASNEDKAGAGRSSSGNSDGGAF